MKPLSTYLKMLLLFAVLSITGISYASVNDSFSVQADNFNMNEGETQTFNFLANDYMDDISTVTITLLDTTNSNISYLGNGSFSLHIPIYDTLNYSVNYTRQFRYKVVSNNDPNISQTAMVSIRIHFDKKNHRRIFESLLLNEKIQNFQIPLPDGFDVIKTNATIINKDANVGRTRLGEYSMNINFNGRNLPFFTYLPFSRPGRDTFEIETHDSVSNRFDTTQLIVMIIPISNANGVVTRWFYKNSINDYDTSSFNVISSDSIISICNGQTSGASIYGSYYIDHGSFRFTPSFLQAGLDSVCLRSISGTSNTYYFITVLEDIVRIKGTLYVDKNSNCTYDTLADASANINGLGIIAINSRNEHYFGTIDNHGNYYVTVPDTGTYTIKLNNNPFQTFTSVCANTVHLTSDYFDSTYLFDVGFNTQYTDCSFPIVNIGTSTNFRRCRTSDFNINYINLGLQAMQNAYIDVTLEEMNIMHATIPYDSLGNSVYRFHINNLIFGQTGTISLTAYVHCDETILGQTLCAEAHIYPDAICTTPSYTGSNIVASVQCLGDSVQFKLQNNGGNMQSIKRYIVIQDDVMRIRNNYNLSAGQTLTETIPTDSGSTYRIVAEREIDFPSVLGDPFTTAAIENCEPIDNFNTGYFTQFPNYDGEPFRSVSCNVIIGSYDPNDKVAFPVGYATQHYIEANTAIDYQINFQNTGNDTAFKIIVVDSIAATLDINSIELGVSSHAFIFQRMDSNTVAFVFNDINLVDSNRNEALSHGFVKFRIKQKANNPDGTKIYNKAAIYFDYNAPIITNQTYHTIGREFIEVRLLSAVKNTRYNIKDVKVFPNPFRDKTQIIVEGEELKDASLILMNMEGQVMKTIPASTPNIFNIYREDLASGMYLFKIMQHNEVVTNGKLVVQ